MKKTMLVLGMVILTMSSCSKLSKVTDSEIDAIRDQTEVLKEQNKILESIVIELKKQK